MEEETNDMLVAQDENVQEDKEFANYQKEHKDELVEITPENIRLRKKILDPTMRIRAKNSK